MDIDLFQRMNYPAAPMGGIFASLRQATGYQSEVILTPQEAGNLSAAGGSNLYPPREDLSASGGLNLAAVKFMQ